MELNGFVIVLLRLQIREIPIRTFPYVVYYCIVFTESQFLQKVNGAVAYSDLNSAKLNRRWSCAIGLVGVSSKWGVWYNIPKWTDGCRSFQS